MKIKVVCFDIDGTLYPKWMTNLKLVHSFFPSPLLAMRYQRFRKHVRREDSGETTPPDSEGFRLRQAAWLARQSRSLVDEDRIELMANRVEAQFYASWRKAFAHLRPYPHVREAFEFLRSKGLRIAALSDFPIGSKLSALDVEDLVSYAECTEESGYLKPHPAPFKLVCDTMEVAPSEVLYVGDSCHKDMFGAARFGMETALIDPSATTERRKERRKKHCGHAGMIFSGYAEFTEQMRKLLE